LTAAHDRHYGGEPWAATHTDLCAAEVIRYIDLADLIEQENWQFG
jgi:hypothetical protein